LISGLSVVSLEKEIDLERFDGSSVGKGPRIESDSERELL